MRAGVCGPSPKSAAFWHTTGKGLERYVQLTVQALKAAAAAGGIVMQQEVVGGQAKVSYVRRDAKPRVVEPSPPPEYTALLETMPALVRMSRFLDPNGV